MQQDTCSVDTCELPVKRHQLCYAHYMKQWRYGTPTPNHPPRWADIRGQRFGTLVVRERDGGKWLCDCDCGEVRAASAGELNRRGDASTCGVRQRHVRENVSYFTAHERVARVRGRAAEHRCADCDGPAAQWSYDHADPNERHDETLSARPVAYSTDPSYYVPRCVPCHKKYDLGRIDAYAAAG